MWTLHREICILEFDLFHVQDPNFVTLSDIGTHFQKYGTRPQNDHWLENVRMEYRDLLLLNDITGDPFPFHPKINHSGIVFRNSTTLHGVRLDKPVGITNCARQTLNAAKSARTHTHTFSIAMPLPIFILCLPVAYDFTHPITSNITAFRLSANSEIETE